MSDNGAEINPFSETKIDMPKPKVDIYRACYTLVQRTELVTALLLTLIIVFLHFIFMGNAGALWRDEVSTFNVATMPSISEVWRSLIWHPFPIFTSMVLRLWTAAVGGSDFRLRVFGFLVGISILGCLWLNARLLTRSVPLLSLVLFALNPLAIQIGDSIRPYGMGYFFILLAFAFIWKVTDQPNILKIIVATLAAVLSVQFLLHNAFLLMAIIFAGVVVTLRRGCWKRSVLLIAMGVVAAISLLPYRQIFREAQQWSALTKDPVTFLWILKVFSQALAAPGQFMLAIWICLFILGIAAAVYLQFSRSPDFSKTERDFILFCSIVMVASISLLVILYKLISISTKPWYYLPSIVLTAVSLDAILRRKGQIVTVFRITLAIFIVVFSWSAVWQKVHTRQTNLDIIASRLERSANKNDMILLHPWFYAVAFQQYYHGPIAFMTIPPIDDFKVHRYDLVKGKMASDDPLQPILDRMTETLMSGHSIWLVGDTDLPLKEQSPCFLPPAPHTVYGWRLSQYMKCWWEQAGCFINSHSSERTALQPVIDKSINPNEDCHIRLIRGWRP